MKEKNETFSTEFLQMGALHGVMQGLVQVALVDFKKTSEFVSMVAGATSRPPASDGAVSPSKPASHPAKVLAFLQEHGTSKEMFEEMGAFGMRFFLGSVPVGGILAVPPAFIKAQTIVPGKGHALMLSTPYLSQGCLSRREEYLFVKDSVEIFQKPAENNPVWQLMGKVAKALDDMEAKDPAKAPAATPPSHSPQGQVDGKEEEKQKQVGQKRQDEQEKEKEDEKEKGNEKQANARTQQELIAKFDARHVAANSQLRKILSLSDRNSDNMTVSSEDMMLSSYHLLQSEMMKLMHLMGCDGPEVCLLISGDALSKDITQRWASGMPSFGLYYRNSHYIPIFNLNVPGMAETVSNLALRTNDHSNADAVKGLLSNVFVAANLAQGDCGPDALRIILMAMKAGGFQPVAEELEKAEDGDARNEDKKCRRSEEYGER